MGSGRSRKRERLSRLRPLGPLDPAPSASRKRHTGRKKASARPPLLGGLGPCGPRSRPRGSTTIIARIGSRAARGPSTQSTPLSDRPAPVPPARPFPWARFRCRNCAAAGNPRHLTPLPGAISRHRREVRFLPVLPASLTISSRAGNVPALLGLHPGPDYQPAAAAKASPAGPSGFMPRWVT